MMKHTPGPWTVDRSMLGELEPFGPDGQHLLSCEVANALPLAEREANGALISAAPDLLQALLGCMKQIEAFDPGGVSRLEEARKAIAKTNPITPNVRAGRSMKYTKLKDSLDGLFAYDKGATDSGIHDEGLRQEIKNHLATLSDADKKKLVDRIIEDFGWGSEDAGEFFEWLEDEMDCKIPRE